MNYPDSSRESSKIAPKYWTDWVLQNFLRLNNFEVQKINYLRGAHMPN